MRIIDLTASTADLTDLLAAWKVGPATTNKLTAQQVIDLHILQVKGNSNLVMLASPTSNAGSGQYNTLLGTNQLISSTSKRNLLNGNGNSITGDDGFVTGGGNTVAGNRCFAAGSNINIAANYSQGMGFGNKLKGTVSQALGQGGGTKRFAEQVFSSISWASQGDNQMGMLHSNGLFTAPASGIVLTNNGEALLVLVDSILAYETHVVGVQISGSPGSVGDHYYSVHRGVIKNISGTTTIHDDVEDVISESHSGAWTAVFAANNTNDSLQITCAGDAGQDIRWSAHTIYTQVGFNTFAI